MHPLASQINALVPDLPIWVSIASVSKAALALTYYHLASNQPNRAIAVHVLSRHLLLAVVPKEFDEPKDCPRSGYWPLHRYPDAFTD